MRQLPMLFLLFAVVIVSSCYVPVEPSQSSLPGEVPGEAVQPPPLPPAVETQPSEAGEAYVVKSAEVVVQEPGLIYPFLGSEDAPLTVTEYGDFSDGVSSFAASSQVASIKRDYVLSNKVKLVFKPYPLRGTDDARLASEASWCMWEQGGKQFWAYYDTLFAFYLHLDNNSLYNYATRIPNFDRVAFTKCLESGKYAGTVEATLSEGKLLGIEETPAFIIGEKTLAGDVPYKKLKAAIAEELSSEGGTSITGNAVFSQESFYGIPKAIVEFLNLFRKI